MISIPLTKNKQTKTNTHKKKKKKKQKKPRPLEYTSLEVRGQFPGGILHQESFLQENITLPCRGVTIWHLFSHLEHGLVLMTKKVRMGWKAAALEDLFQTQKGQQELLHPSDVPPEAWGAHKFSVLCQTSAPLLTETSLGLLQIQEKIRSANPWLHNNWL